MAGKPTCEELGRRVKGLEHKVERLRGAAWEQQESEREKEAILNSLVEHVIHEDKEMRIYYESN